LQPLKRAAANEAKFIKSLEVPRFGFGKKNFKKNTETIVGLKKGFYICTRLARKRAGERKKQVHRHIELTA
jgi:hypothetical protein